jgi:hypothetical protein
MTNLKYSRNGIQEFFWPINNNDTQKVIRDVIHETVIFFRSLSHDQSRETILLKVANSYFLKKALSVYYIKASEKEFLRKSHHDVSVDFLSQKDNLLSENQYLENLRTGLRREVQSNPRFYGLVIDGLKTVIKNDGFTRRNIKYIPNYSGKIICTGGGDAAQRYLKDTQQKAFLVKIGDFYPFQIKDSAIYKNIKSIRYKASYIEYIDFIRVFFRSNNIDLSTREFEDLINWLDHFLAYTIEYFHMLEAPSNKIPKILWTSSAGILWNRLLAIKVRENGGEVLVFDHANGANINSNTFMPFVECQDLDTFVTFSSVQKKYFEEKLATQIYNLFPKPNIVALTNIE